MRSIFAASSGRSWILPNNPDAHNGPALAGPKRPGTTVAHLMLLLPDAGSGSSRDRLRASSTPLYGTPGDVDDNGGLDLVVVNRDAAASLLINRTQRGHWLRFDVLAAIGRDAYGATVSATVDSQRLTRDVQPSASYLASSDPRSTSGSARRCRRATSCVGPVVKTKRSGILRPAESTTYGKAQVDAMNDIREDGACPRPRWVWRLVRRGTGRALWAR